MDDNLFLKSLSSQMMDVEASRNAFSNILVVLLNTDRYSSLLFAKRVVKLEACDLNVKWKQVNPVYLLCFDCKRVRAEIAPSC